MKLLRLLGLVASIPVVTIVVFIWVTIELCQDLWEVI